MSPSKIKVPVVTHATFHESKVGTTAQLAKFKNWGDFKLFIC
jgi:hypothetical protein